MAWNDMCKSTLTVGHEVTRANLCGPTPTAALITGTGLPAAATLGKFVGKAQALKLKPTNSGISFHIVNAFMNGNDVATTVLYKDIANKNKSASVCFEDEILPRKSVQGHTILVHQSLAPCRRCRTGYKTWAQTNVCTIVLSADDGYDGTPANAIFVFSPTGVVYYVT